MVYMNRKVKEGHWGYRSKNPDQSIILLAAKDFIANEYIAEYCGVVRVFPDSQLR